MTTSRRVRRPARLYPKTASVATCSRRQARRAAAGSDLTIAGPSRIVPASQTGGARMQARSLGKTGLTVSTLGFGCGNVGGLIIRGTPAERERAVARAMELGINYFDTAPSYGDGESEKNLGQVLKTLKARVQVGTKFRLDPPDLHDIPGAVARSLDQSLKRLAMERVDLFQLHNRIESGRGRNALSLGDVLNEVVPAVQKLRQQGKVGFCGITALGETRALHQAIDSGAIDTAQVCYNLLNPSAGIAVPSGFPAQDFDRLLDRTRAR